MKQVVQRRGRVTVEDVPAPAMPRGFVLVGVSASLVSSGTERLIAQAGQKSLFEKAIARPELARQVLERISADGLATTIDAIRSRLDEPAALGYAASGTVLEVDSDESTFKVGDAVACAGAGFANHAEVICVPRQLCAHVPTGVTLEDAAFGTLGAIALHGVRLASLQVGETVAVIGVGLLGQISAQIATASGCRVVAVDLAEDRLALARELGADGAATPDAAVALARSLTGGLGVDAVLITADTSSNDPIELAGEMARDRATIVAVGSIGLDVPRPSYYRKELKLLVSRSYGPGRYDPAYELDGHDYPIGYVRWTEQRNLGAFLDLIARGRVRVAPLVTHTFPVGSAPDAYDLITGRTPDRFLGVILKYPDPPDTTRVVRRRPEPASPRSGRPSPRIGVLGAGNFAKSILLPALRAADARFVGIVSRQGLNAKICAERFSFDYFASDEARVLSDTEIDAVVIATRHGLHASQALAAARSGKDVFVEKPLCLTLRELDELEDVFSKPTAPRLMVGFNRRFAPLAAKLKAFFDSVGRPLAVHYRVNAGSLPPDHWVHDSAEGGGRVIGEVCHFVDFLGWLIDSPPVAVAARRIGRRAGPADDDIVLDISYTDGSVGTISYVTTGEATLGKERIEAHGGGRSAVLDEFRQLDLYRDRRHTSERLRGRPDKGHEAECKAFLAAVALGTASPIDLHDLVRTTRVTFLALESARSGGAVIPVPA